MSRQLVREPRRITATTFDGERERGPSSGTVASNRHVAAHQTNETHADGETETRATLAPRSRRVHLREGREQFRLVPRGDAGAGVHHLEEQRDGVVVGVNLGRDPVAAAGVRSGARRTRVRSAARARVPTRALASRALHLMRESRRA